MENELNLLNCCRACLRTNCNLTPISAADNDSIIFIEKLSSCVSEVEWTTTNRISQICDGCIDQLRVTYNFRSTCITADETLKECFQQAQHADIDIKKGVLENSNYVDSPDYEDVKGNIIDLQKNQNSTSIDSLPDEDTNNSEYLHLKHFLDSEDDIAKNEAMLPDDHVSEHEDSDSPEPFIIYNQNQNIEIEVQDIEEIIIQDKPDKLIENKLIPDSANDYNINSINTSLEHARASESADAEQLQNNLVKNSCVGSCNANIKTENTSQDDDDNNITVKVISRLLGDKPIVLAEYSESTSEHVIDKNKILLEALSQPLDMKTVGVQATPTPEIKKIDGTTCTECGKSYRKKANLKVHMRTHTGEKPFACEYCDRRFYHSSHLREHIRRHRGEKPYRCNICDKRFTIKGELNMHMRSHTGERPYACNVCERRCLTHSDLKVHMRIHTGEKPYSCEFCGKNFGNLYILSSHKKVHTGERPYGCKLCEKTFTQSSHLNVHMRRHTGEKVSCKHCSATFVHSSQLTIHLREHTGKQPYKCGVCDKICNYASELQAHMVKHTGEKFQCSICQKQFTTPAYLQEHKRIHTGQNLYPCTICTKSFTRSGYLDKHLRSHTGEKPFACMMCDKTFSQSSSLKVHVRSHTGERPYACELCNKKFASSSDLSAHNKRHKKYINL